MPPIETSDRYQKAVLWSVTGSNNYGDVIRSDPVELTVRWEDDSRDVRDADGTVLTLAATVVVDREVAKGSLMWLGELANWYGTGSAGDEDDVMQVVETHTTPDLSNKFIRRTLGLMKYRDTP